jgi:effector-binding domain-containing protein
MRIIKYLFLLFLLSLVALTIFIATQKGNYTVESSKIINSPKATVFNYVNDYKNWQKFCSWITEDNSKKLSYSPISTGKGSTFTWEATNDNGTIETLYAKANDSIVQKMELNGNNLDVFISFKDTIGKTKVTWKSKGRMDFMMKVNSFFTGGTQNSQSTIYNKSLANLDRALNLETNIYSVKVKGIVTKLETFYLRQSFTSKINDITRNTNVIFPKIITFCTQNNINMNGKPFVIYHTYDTIKSIAKVSFCIPIKEQIFTSEGSEILSGKLVAFNAVKTTLNGNYTFIKEAQDKSTAFFKTNNLTADPKFSHLAIYTIGKNESKSPSKWVTEMYYPIKPKAAPATYKRVVRDSTATITPPIKSEESEF